MAMKSTHYYTREERKTMIITRFAILMEAHGVVWLTVGEIGKGIGLVYSSHLKGIVYDMVAEGKLAHRDAVRPGVGEVREFSLTPGTFQLPAKRKIQFKVKGVVQGQLELGI
jgi:hypothetical protein